MSNYKKCDCCGQIKPEEELEDVVITIKKCKSCDISKAPVLENGGFTSKPLPNFPEEHFSKIPERPQLKSLGGRLNNNGTVKAKLPPILGGVDMDPPGE